MSLIGRKIEIIHAHFGRMVKNRCLLAAIPARNHKISSKNNELQKKVRENEKKNLQDNQEAKALAGIALEDLQFRCQLKIPKQSNV